ncbi:hypothetical protein F4810DRAFT_658473 [Camillea tinctor]|nr:hypothetical protein F4810DRAFT_658473 [Camillea tinctor]
MMVDPGTYLTVADICFKLGRRVTQACKDWKNADAEVEERKTKVEFCWMQTQVQLEFILRIKDSLDPEFVGTIENVLFLLSTKLSLATTKLENLRATSEAPDGTTTLRIRRFKYSGSKKSLDEIIADLEEWQRRFDPLWFLLMTLANPVIDSQIRDKRQTYSPFSLAGGLRAALQENPSEHTSVFMAHDGIELSDIALATAKHGRRNGKSYIVDPFAIPPQSDLGNERENVRNLARKLRRADPTTFRLLQCKGVINDPKRDPASFKFVYALPANLARPRCLRRALLDDAGPLQLADKVRVARDLATSVGYVHNFNFVHKSIRPENILLFDNEGAGPGPETFLVGFENFRAADGPTRRAGDEDWEKDLYRHPSRQGAVPGAMYRMQHDIFSLGVCLLEVGLSRSFVVYPPGSGPSHGPLYGDVVGPVTEGLVSEALKVKLVAYAKAQLPGVVGPKYAAVVVTCLTCLDKDNEDFGEATMKDEDGILVGARFIEKIITKLSEINL